MKLCGSCLKEGKMAINVVGGIQYVWLVSSVTIDLFYIIYTLTSAKSTCCFLYQQSRFVSKSYCFMVLRVNLTLTPFAKSGKIRGQAHIGLVQQECRYGYYILRPKHMLKWKCNALIVEMIIWKEAKTVY